MTQNNNNNPAVSPATVKPAAPAAQPAAAQTVKADEPKAEVADKK